MVFDPVDCYVEVEQKSEDIMAKAPSTSRTTKSTTTRRTSTTARKTKSKAGTTKATVSGATVTPRKTATAAAKSATTRKVPTDVVVAPNVSESAPSALPEMRKRELIDAVVDRCGIKKKYAKPAVEAALAILGEALEEGRSLQMPPLGKVKVQRAKELEDGQVIVAKVRRKTQSDEDEGKKSEADALAKAAE